MDVKKKLRILHVSNSNLFSGAENVVCQIIRLFGSDEDIEMTYACPEGQICQVLTELGVAHLPMKELNGHELRRVVDAYKPDLIHSHDVRATVLAARFHKRAALVSTIHVNDVSMRSLSPKVAVFCLAARRMRHIFWVSGSCYEQYYFKNRVSSKSSVLTNVIDRDALVEKMNTDPNAYPYDIVYVGRLSPQKNPLRLAGVLALAASKKPGLRAAVIGSGELEARMKAKLDELGIAGNVSLLGYKFNPYKLLHDAAAMVMTSDFEGTPMVALEAMALGVPIVSTPVDGMRDLVVEGKTGYLSDDDEVLAERLVQLVNDPALRRALSDDALERFAQIADLGAYKEALAKVYRT